MNSAVLEVGAEMEPTPENLLALQSEVAEIKGKVDECSDVLLKLGKKREELCQILKEKHMQLDRLSRRIGVC
jgi:uncharacterized coiled-coil DUF342 family protein